MSYMAQGCGAWQIGADPGHGAVRFRVFLPTGADPHITSIRVAGSFQSQLGGADWDFAGGLALTRVDGDPAGTFWEATTADLAIGFYEYKYLVTFDNGEARIVTDPCARYGGLKDTNSGIVVGGSQPAGNVVRPLVGGRKPLPDLNLYELMIDDFTAEYRLGRAPLDAVIEKLDYLQAMGVNGVLFMPWTAWRNRGFDWGYEPFQYFAVESRYTDAPGLPAEKLSWLKELVSACHDRGIHVIMDGVFNHVSKAFPYQQLYLHEHDCPFTAESFGGTFPGLQDLDFANSCTGDFVLDVCRYWTNTFGIDGIRFDNTVNFYVAGNPKGLPELLGDLQSGLVAAGEQNFSLTLEHIDISAANVTNTTAATSFWDNSLFGLTFGYLWNDHIDAHILNALNNRRFLLPGKVPTLYLSNHDHSHVAWQAGARQNVGATGAWWKLQPYVMALFTSTGVPLIHNGQEFGEEHFLPEDDHNTGRRVTSRPLRWMILDDPIGRTLHALHGTLARARLAHPALRSETMWPAEWDDWQTQFNPAGAGVDLARQLVIYHRWATLDNGDIENVVVVLNFSDNRYTVPVPFPTAGTWSDLLANFDGSGAPWSVDVAGITADITVESHWGRILIRTNHLP